MSATTITEDEDKKQIVDDISEPEEKIDLSKLAALKAKVKKDTDMASKIVAKKERSLNFGVIGSGQAGSRIAEAYHKLGYDTVVINTAIQDLKFIDVPDSNKLLLEYGLGGASKELAIGRSAAEQHREAIAELINEKLSNSQVNILCLSLGGGSGAGSCETMVDILTETGKPLVVTTVLPLSSDDAQTKANSLETLSYLSKQVQAKRVQNLIVVDNARIEAILSNVSQMDFYPTANKIIVEPIDSFNTLSSMASSTKGLDPMEWAKLFTDSEGLSIYGQIEVENFEDETALAEAVLTNLDSNLLASGFDIKQSKYVGVIFAGNKEVSSKITNSAVNYALAILAENTGTPRGVFRGSYVIDEPKNVVKIYFMLSGLGLPESRVTQLKDESQEQLKAVKTKDDSRNLNLQLDTGKDSVVSEAQKIRDKIQSKNSAFGRFVTSVTDKKK